MENMRNRLDMELVCTEKRIQKLINKPTFKYCTRYSDNLVAITMGRKIIDFCKPIYIGKYFNAFLYAYLYFNISNYINRICCTRYIQDSDVRLQLFSHESSL